MKDEKKAVLITFSVKSEKFESNSERNKFFKTLYGWNQTVVRDASGTKAHKKTYEYRREGILDEIPHEKIDQSSFIIPENKYDEIESFFKEWHNKVMWRTFKVLMDDEEDIFENFRKRMKMMMTEEEE